MPGAGPLMRADFPRLWANRLPFLKMLIGQDRWPEAEQMWMSLFNIQSSNKMREEMLMHSGFGSFAQIGEGESVTYDSLISGPRKSFTHVLYGKGFQIGLLAARQDIDGLIRKNAPLLGAASRMSIQRLAAEWWDNTFTTSLTADGLSVCNGNHTFIRGGGTWSNTVATALGNTALETALVSFAKLLDVNGDPQPLPSTGCSLLIPPDLMPLAYKLFATERVIGDEHWDRSFVKGKFTIAPWPYLASTTAWWLLAPKQYREVHWFWNIKPETSNGFDFDTETAKTKILFACSYGAVDPRGIYGSTGAG